jgi:signal transduction histidine kinase
LLEPRDDDNASAIGFDLASEPEQVDAMNRARDLDLPGVTELLEPKSCGPAAGTANSSCTCRFIVAVNAIESIEQRRRALVGFVFSRLSPDVIFSDSIAAATVRYLDIAIYDSSKNTDALLVSSGEGKGGVQSSATLTIGGRQWLLVASSRQSNMAALPPEAQRTFVVGALVSLLLFALMRAQVRAWQTAERHAMELRAADRAKDEFLAVLSHELRTPLNVVLGWLSMLRSGGVREDRQAHALDIIDRNARTQAQLIDDLLEVSRILMGKMRLDKQPLSVVPAITAVVDSLRPAADAKDVALHGIDGAAGTFIIAADAGRFAQIITNLVCQWREVHAARRRGLGERRGRRRAREDFGPRYGHRHRSRFSAVRVRPVPSGRRLTDALSQRPRHGPGDCARPGPPAWRPHRRLQRRSQSGRGICHHAAAHPVDGTPEGGAELALVGT